MILLSTARVLDPGPAALGMRLLGRQQRLNGRPHLIRDEPHTTQRFISRHSRGYRGEPRRAVVRGAGQPRARVQADGIWASLPAAAGPIAAVPARGCHRRVASGPDPNPPGWRWSGSFGPAKGAGREALDAGAPQQSKHPHRVGRAALVASGPDPPEAPQSVRVVSPSASPAPR